MSEMFNLRSAPELSQKPLRFMQIDTFYQKPLEILYGRNPNLSNLTFSEQMDAILKDGFAAIHTIGPYMSNIGYDAQWIIGNCVPTQVQWAHEHGFQFKDNNTAMYDIVRAQVDTFKPDILYTTDSILFDSKFIRTLNHHPKLVIGWQAADIPPGADWSGFDIILSPLEGVRSTALELGAKYAEYFLPGFPEWIHKQVQKIESSVDVSFCGQWNLIQHGHRNDLLQQVALAASEDPSFSCGFYLSGQVNAIPPEVARYNRGERYGMDMYRSIRTGKIGLDARGSIRLFRHDSGKGVGDSDIAGRETANMRIFETTGCGVFLLTEHFDNLNQFFEPGQEIETFRNEKELIEKIRYYLAHPREREEIAQRGYERCRCDHSIQQSTRLLDTIIHKHLTVEASYSGQTVSPLSHEAWSVIEANRDLLNIKNIGLHSRFGRWQIQLEDLTVYCHDLVSFYYSARDIFLNRIYDFEATNPQPTIIDGGGFIGLFTLYAKKKYPQARVTIFEPNPEALPLLKGNLAVNNIQDITLVEAGLYNHNGVIPFESDGSDGSSAYTHQATSYIKVNRLNDFINSEVDFLKLNIEGAEWAVIADIEPKLKFVRELVIEYHGFPETGQNLHKILAVLDRAGFRYFIHDFDRESNPTTKPPFKIAPETRFFQLIYAKRLFSPVESEVAETASSVTAPSLQPVSRMFGFDRGIPLDRYYIERFLEQNSALIQGRVLEIGDNTYTRRFGHDVTRSDILSYTPAPGATIIGDLVTEKRLPEVTFDCIILTQTLQMIYDLKTALQNLYKALKPGGSLLISASGISQISRYDMDQWGEYWRFTDKSLKMLLAEFVPEKAIHVETFGNVAVAKAFLDGLAVSELPGHILDYRDNDYQVILVARVQKPDLAAVSPTGNQVSHKENSFSTPLILLYHRVADDPVNVQLLAVSPQNFEAHLKELSENYRVLSLRSLLEELRQGMLKPDTVALTFDDGYLDNLTNALPLLEKYQIPATIFVTSGMIGSEREFWWDTLENIFLTGHPLPDELSINHAQGTRTWKLTTLQGRLLAYDELCESLRGKPVPKITTPFIDNLLNWAGLSPTGRSTHRVLNPIQLKQLAASSYIEIGAHTVSHSRLSALPIQQQRDEIRNSKEQLEMIIHKPVRLLSFPYGTVSDFTGDTTKIAAEEGFEAGIANVQGNIITPVNLFTLPRRLVRDWNGDVLAQWLQRENKNQLEAETVSDTRFKLVHSLSGA